MNNKFNKEELYNYFDGLIHNKNNIDLTEFLKWRQKFKMYNYTWNNQMILVSQAEKKNITPVFGTIKEWNEKENCLVAKGEKANVIIMPKLYKLYKVNKEKVTKDINDCVYGVKVLDYNTNSYYFSAQNKSDYFKLQKLADEKKIDKQEFYRYELVPNQFSIDQTNLPEEKRVDYLKRFETKDINPEAGKELLNNLLKVADMFNIEVIFDNEHKSHTGYLTGDNAKIYVYEEAPVESQASILAHELGHYILQSKINGFNSKYAKSKENYEIQAELFSKLICSYYNILGKNEFSDKYIAGYLEQLKYNPDLCMYCVYINNNFSFDKEALSEKIASCKNDKQIEHVVEDLNNEKRDYVKSKVESMKTKVFYNDFEIVDKYSKKLINVLDVLKENNQEKIDESFNDLKELNTKDIYINFTKDDVYSSENRKEKTGYEEASEIKDYKNFYVKESYSVDKDKITDYLNKNELKNEDDFLKFIEKENNKNKMVFKNNDVYFGKDIIYSSISNEEADFSDFKLQDEFTETFDTFVSNKKEALAEYDRLVKEKEDTNNQWLRYANKGILISEDLYDHFTGVIDTCSKHIKQLEEKYPNIKEEYEKSLTQENEMER